VYNIPVLVCIPAGNEIYFSNSEIPDNPSQFVNGLRYLMPRIEQANDGYATQATAYALMAHIKHNGMGVDSGAKIERDSMMRWLNSMRNFFGGMASTQVICMFQVLPGYFTQVYCHTIRSYTIQYNVLNNPVSLTAYVLTS